MSSPFKDPLRCPLRVEPVSAGHVILESAVAILYPQARVTGNTAPKQDNLNCFRCLPELNLLSGKLKRHAVKAALNINVIVEINSRKTAIIHIVATLTAASAMALVLGFLTRAGITAAPK